MAAFNDTVTTTITIDGKQAVNQLGALQSEISGLNQKLQSVGNESKKLSLEQKKVADSIKQVTEAMAAMAQEGKQDTEEYKKMSAEMIDLNKKKKALSEEIKKTRIEEKLQTDEINRSLVKARDSSNELREKLGLQGMTLKQLKAYQKDLNFEMNNTIKDSQGYETVKAKIQAVTKAINDQQADIKDTRTAWEKMKGSVKEFGVVAGGVIAGEIVTGLWAAAGEFVAGVVQGAAKLSDELADIQKSTGMTAQEVKDLNSSLSKIDTRTSSADLRSIAKVAGQLGIAKNDVLGFVESVDKINVALGDEFQGGTEQVARELGTIKMLFKETKDMSPAEAMERIGSSINALGAAGSATGPEIAEFSKRIGALGKMGPTITQTLGLGAAFQELGLSAEMSSGGLTSIFLTAGNKSKEFATQMGISTESFKEMLNNNPNEMLMTLAQSFAGLSTDQTIAALARMGVGSQEAIKVMSLLAEKTDFVREKQKLAADEMEKNTSLQNEFNLKNTNFAAEMEKAKKQINGLVASISSFLLPVMTTLISSFISVGIALKELPKFLKENQQWFIALGVALVTFNGQAILANANAIRLAATSRAISIATRAWSIAQVALNVVLTANPIGLVVTAVALLTAGIITAYQKSENFRNILNGLWESLKVVGDAIGNFLISVTEFDIDGMIKAFSGIGKKMADAYTTGFNSDRDKFLVDSFAGTKDKKAAKQKKADEDWAKSDKDEAVRKEKDKQAAINQARAGEMAKGDNADAKARAEKLKKEKDEFDDFLKEIRQRSEDEMAIYMAQAGDINRIKFSTAKPKSNIQLIGEKNSAELAPEEAADPNAAFDKFNRNKKAGGELTLLKATLSKNADIILSAKKDLMAIERDIELSATDLTENEKALIREKYRQQEIDAEKNAGLAKAQAAIEMAGAGLDAAKAIVGAKFAIESGNAEREKQAKLAQLDDEYKQGLISKQGYEAAKSDIEGEFAKKAAALKTKQAKAEKVAAIFQALISGAAAVVKALPNIPLSILAGVAAAASVASIIATPIPDFSGGSEGAGSGNAPTGGYYDGGPTQRSPSDRTPVGIVHANEYVIPAGLLRKPEIANMAGVIESMRTGGRPFLEGGFTSPSAQTPTSGLEAKIDRLINAIYEMASRPIKTYVVARDVQDELDDWNRIQDESRFG